MIRVAYTGICGTDLGFYSGRRGLPSAGETVLGHEIAGVVEETGDAASSFRKGDPVTVSMITGCGECEHCRRDEAIHCPQGGRIGINRDGGFAEYVSVPVRNLAAVPAGVPLHVATLADPLACVLEGLSRLAGCRLDRVLVLGGGPIGLLTAMILRQDANCGSVSLVDSHPWRRDCASSLGARSYAGVAESGNDGRRFSAIVEASGSGDLLTAGVELLEPRGGVLVLGLHHHPAALPLLSMLQRQVRMEFSLCYGFRAFEAAVAYLGRQHTVAAGLITALRPSEEAGQAFAAALREKRGKTVLAFRP